MSIVLEPQTSPKPELLELFEIGELGTEEKKHRFAVKPITDSAIAEANDRTSLHSAVHLKAVFADGASLTMRALDEIRITALDIQRLFLFSASAAIENFLPGRPVVKIHLHDVGICGKGIVCVAITLHTPGFEFPEGSKD